MGPTLEGNEYDNGFVPKNFAFPPATTTAGEDVLITIPIQLLSHAISNYPTDKISIMAIYVDKDLPAPVPPCGLCRQSLVEAEARQNQKFKILLISKSGTILQFESCGDLLPFAFNGDFL